VVGAPWVVVGAVDAGFVVRLALAFVIAWSICHQYAAASDVEEGEVTLVLGWFSLTCGTVR